MDISSMLEVQVKEEADIKENVTPRDAIPGTATASASISQEESNFYKLMFGNDVASVRYRRLHCTACDMHIGSAPSRLHNMYEHPVLRTLLCERCYNFYGDGTFEQGDDATDMFCRWCANGGNLYCCSYCSNTFCYKCIRRNFTSLVRRKIEADEKWKCFVCNPSDLYSARAVCWALRQHVQTVVRILKNEKKMSSEEIAEKMNLDESPCCPRRSKRRRRKVESNSEEEDETYMPKANGLPIHLKRKQTKKMKPITVPTKYSIPNGTITRQMQSYSAAPIPIRPRPSTLPDSQPFRHAESQPTFPHKSSKIECKEPNSKLKDALSSSNVLKSEVSLSPYDSSILQSYHTTVMNTAGSSTYVRQLASNPSTHKIILSSLQTQTNSYKSTQSLQSSSNAMVSIPNPAKNCVPRLLLHKSRKSNVTLTPNIIELDSDSDDELKVIGQHSSAATADDNGEADMVNISSGMVVPVALVSTENNCDDDTPEEQPLREMCTTLKKDDVSFNQAMSPHVQELDNLLSDLNERVHYFFALPDNDMVKDVELTAHQKIQQFYRNMRDTVMQLAHVNDRAVRSYNEWKRLHCVKNTPSLTNCSTLTSQENFDISLDMSCVNDSDTETECEKSDYQIMEPSRFIKTSNILKDLLTSKKAVANSEIGDRAPSEHKAVQVYDIVSRDYEKCISYSLLTKADYDPKTKENIMRPVAIVDENFGKYEEQFIFYLQHIEDHGIETDDMKGLPNSNETILKQSVETNSLPISCQKKHCDKKRNSKSLTNVVVSDDITSTNTTSDKIREISQDANEVNLGTSKRTNDVSYDKNSHNMELRKIRINQKVTSIALMSDSDNVSLIKSVSDAIEKETATAGSEEDCTIIDD